MRPAPAAAHGLPHRAPPLPCPRQAGVGLIEVMVAVLLLSVGFLGVGALLAMSLSTNNSSMARSMATVDSYSILDSMRADIINAKAGSYNKTVVANACAGGSGSASLAKTQLQQWCTQLGNHLGASADTTGTVNCLQDGNCVITITYDDSRTQVAGTKPQTVVTKALL